MFHYSKQSGFSFTNYNHSVCFYPTAYLFESVFCYTLKVQYSWKRIHHTATCGPHHECTPKVLLIGDLQRQFIPFTKQNRIQLEPRYVLGLEFIHGFQIIP